jgi:hypothetical protein
MFMNQMECVITLHYISASTIGFNSRRGKMNYKHSPKYHCVLVMALLGGFQVGYAQESEAPESQWQKPISSEIDTSQSMPPNEMPSHPQTSAGINAGYNEMTSPALPTGKSEYLHMQWSAGNSQYQFGRVLAWGGVAAYLVGNFAGLAPLSLVGSLSMTIGIPVMGVGAGKAERASLALNPNGNVSPHTGWPVYWTGWGLQAGGLVLIIGGIASNIETDEYGDSQISDNAVAPILTGALAFIAGGICHYVAWYQFSERLDQSGLNMAGLTYEPTLHWDRGQVDGGGMKLSLAF